MDCVVRDARQHIGQVVEWVDAGALSALEQRQQDRRALAARVAACAARVKLSAKVTPHIFRHACATHMIRNRANIRHVQEMLGHAKLDTTQKYLQLTITDLKEAHPLPSARKRRLKKRDIAFFSA